MSRNLMVFEALLVAGIVLAIAFASPIDGAPAGYATVTPILRAPMQ